MIYIILVSFIFANEPDSLLKKEYFGGWPINKNKDQIDGAKLDFDCPNNIGCECIDSKDCINNNCVRSPRGSYCYPQKNDIFPEFISLDQYDELVNIYDFAMQGKYILIELGASWCSPCNLLANWFAYDDESIFNKSFWKPEYKKIRDMINNEEIYFITILYEDENRNNASYYTSYEWFDNYPDENIPVLIDDNKLLHTWSKPTGIPAITLLDENMKIINFSSRGLNKSFDILLSLINSNEETK